MKTIIFDLDGTLLNSLEDIATCMNEVLNELNFSPIPTQNYKLFLGGGVDVLSQSVVKFLHSELDYQILSQKFKALYDTQLFDKTAPYEGILDMLESLKMHKLAILSNKPHELCVRYVDKFFHGRFSQVCGAKQGVNKKPHPQSLEQIISELDSDKNDCFFIGDSEIDIATAKNASIASIAVSWGFRSEEFLLNKEPDFLVHSPNEIAKLFMQTFS